MNMLREKREQAGLTLEELAQSTGYSIGFLSHLENGSRNPSMDTMRVLASALDSKVSEIFFPEESEAKKK